MWRCRGQARVAAGAANRLPHDGGEVVGTVSHDEGTGARRRALRLSAIMAAQLTRGRRDWWRVAKDMLNSQGVHVMCIDAQERCQHTICLGNHKICLSQRKLAGRLGSELVGAGQN